MPTDPQPLPGLLPDAEPLAVGPRRVTCRLCGHPLTDRASRRWGVGRDCRRKLHARGIRGPGRFDVEQDGLFDD